jgi:hypothetical protein
MTFEELLCALREGRGGRAPRGPDAARSSAIEPIPPRSLRRGWPEQGGDALHVRWLNAENGAPIPNRQGSSYRVTSFQKAQGDKAALTYESVASRFLNVLTADKAPLSRSIQQLIAEHGPAQAGE